MALVKFALAILLFTAPIIIVTVVVVRWQNRRAGRFMERLVDQLGLRMAEPVGNRLFEFPCALGVLEGHPVWLGTTSGKRNGRGDRRYIVFQVVVGRQPDNRVGPQHMDRAPLEIVSFTRVAAALRGSLNASWLRRARSGVLQGGQEIEVHDDVIVRTLATPAITSASWARLAAASARVLVEYARHLAPAAHVAPLATRGDPVIVVSEVP